MLKKNYCKIITVVVFTIIFQFPFPYPSFTTVSALSQHMVWHCITAVIRQQLEQCWTWSDKSEDRGRENRATITSVEDSVNSLMCLTPWYQDESKSRALRGRLSYFHSAAAQTESCHSLFCGKHAFRISPPGAFSPKHIHANHVYSNNTLCMHSDVLYDVTKNATLHSTIPLFIC